MKYYLIAGEASGDLHGSNLVREIRKQDPAARIRGWGGDLMQEAGAEIVKHYRELAFMGLSDVLTHLPAILRNFNQCKTDILSFRPDSLVLIDYPGFNLRMARWAKARGLKVIYYISPQVWAWKESRVKQIRKSVNRMLVILPFEQQFYGDRGYPVEYVGHPLVDLIRGELSSPAGKLPTERPVVALLPGSRKQEVRAKLPLMISMADHFPGYDFIIAQAPNLEDDFLSGLVQGKKGVRILKGRTYDLLRQARAALVTSGTATLETALFGVPEIVCYKTSPLTYRVARSLIRVKYISLVNLIMDRPVVPELIQKDFNAATLRRELERLLQDEPLRKKMKGDFRELWMKLGEGRGSARAARSIVEFTRDGDGR
ncbi:MAG TPA: lipid-A-disaccharide synthase [Chitinophagaceae bacterium]|nr:lipid-A-disaccharide synthase [Chitinophagaceae bacterium]